MLNITTPGICGQDTSDPIANFLSKRLALVCLQCKQIKAITPNHWQITINSTGWTIADIIIRVDRSFEDTGVSLRQCAHWDNELAIVVWVNKTELARKQHALRG